MYIYFIRCGRNGGPIKIGYAKDVEKRMNDLQVASPFTLSILAKIPVDSKKKAEKMEAWFHDRFFKKHIRGEWFMGSIKIKQLEACIGYAETDRDWDEVRAENGGRYQTRGKTRPLNNIEKTNMEKTDHKAAKRSAQKKFNAAHRGYGVVLNSSSTL